MKLPETPGRITPGFIFGDFERMLEECLSDRKFGKAEKLKVLEYFGDESPRCVYCGSTEVRRWDHLVAVRSGGETVLGNLVPACAPCDNTKGKTPFDEFLRGRDLVREEAEERIERLRGYMAAFEYKVVPLDERLTDDESERLAALRAKAGELRAEVEALIEDHRQRTGAR
jgi:hypothetical protein